MPLDEGLEELAVAEITSAETGSPSLRVEGLDGDERVAGIANQDEKTSLGKNPQVQAVGVDRLLGVVRRDPSLLRGAGPA